MPNETDRLSAALKETQAQLDYYQHKYKALVEEADDAILVVDLDSAQFIEVNQAACRILGYEREEFQSLTGRGLHPESESLKVNALSDEINRTGKGFNPAMRFLRKDGRTFWGSARMWTYEIGGRRLYTCIIRDVTAQVVREEDLANTLRQLRATQAQLIQAGRLSAMGALGAGIAHELNQPLTAIQGFAQRMLRCPERPVQDYLDELEIIASEATRMAGIVDNIRTFARGGKFSPQPIAALKPIRMALALIQGQLAGHGIEVALTDRINLPLILADGPKLQQVFLNLLVNALDALVETHNLAVKRIEITAWKERENVVYRIDDSGPGVSPEMVPRLFDPFVTSKQPGKGTGMGLSISYGILADHNGEIAYSRSQLGGASFTLRIPMAPAQ
jgi:PAS domain S-box-containing protein